MKIRIYQIDSGRDSKRVMYENHESTLKHAGKIDPSAYNTVFDGEVDCNNLDAVYTQFNSNIPFTHQGHSLSVSDIVEVVKTDEQNSQSVQSGCYFCDSVGFVRLEEGFDSTLAQPMRGNRMLVVEPHKPPYEAVISDDYKAWQRAVGGTFECTYPFAKDNTFIISNDEAKLIGLEGKRIINGDIYAGVFLIARDDGEGGTRDLTDEQISRYTKQFEADETYTQDEVEDSAGMFFIGFN